MKVNDILTPALIVEKSVLEENIKFMNEVCKKTGISVRPHYKSNKCLKIAKMQIENGAKGICCAKLGEAVDLVNGGFEDVLLANQVISENKMRILTDISKKSKVTVCADNLDNLKLLNKVALEEKVVVNVFVEFNIGQNRCGVNTYEDFYELAKFVEDSEGLYFGGIQAYAGHLAQIYDYEKRKAASGETESNLRGLIKYLGERNIEAKEVSGVSTGTLRFRESMDSVYTETQPGSYVFMDCSYIKVGTGFKNSLFILATVVSVKEDTVVTDAGLKSISTDMGKPVLVGYENVDSGMSEEHVIHKIENHNFKVGDIVRYIPSHCCTNVNLHDELNIVHDDEVVEVFKVDSRGKYY